MEHIFKRYEAKYLITEAQAANLLTVFSQHMTRGKFDAYLVQNLYYDTDNWDVVRTSITKPVYKEKMRLRCYGIPERESKLFLELKKKYKGIVYKRRIGFSNETLSARCIEDLVEEETSQISRELKSYLQTHPVYERMYISHHRHAFTGKEDKSLRITFDTDLRYRLEDLTLADPRRGTAILPPGQIIMEIKTQGGMPLWLTRALSQHKAYPTSFSKYGTCYTDYIQKQRERGHEACLISPAVASWVRR